MKWHFVFVILAGFSLFSCTSKTAQQSDKIKIVTTTTIVSDLIKNIGGDKVEVTGLMGPGVDPHLYKASEGDVIRLFGADIIVFGGLHLEGKMSEIFEKMGKQGKIYIDLGSHLDHSKLKQSANFGGNYDPHVWFDVTLFEDMAKAATSELIRYRPGDKDYFESRLKAYLVQLDELENYLHTMAESIPADQRRLVTAHDAFSYFGKAYGFDVVGLQGISTATEAGVSDVRQVTDYIVEHKVKSIFVESSVPKRTVEALQKAVLARNHQVNIGGMLYSDALGSPDTPEGTYIGMFKYNMKTIVDGLK